VQLGLGGKEKRSSDGKVATKRRKLLRLEALRGQNGAIQGRGSKRRVTTERRKYTEKEYTVNLPRARIKPHSAHHLKPHTRRKKKSLS